jgi:hypothetical protein
MNSMMSMPTTNTNVRVANATASTPPTTPPSINSFSTSSTQNGGKRRVLKSSSKKPVKEEKKDKQQKDSKKELNGKKQVQNKQDLKSKKEKKGGSFVADVNNLAVPFAILLAKEGLSKVFKKDTKKASVSPKTARKPSSLRRKSTLAGGSCNLGCGAMTGGRAARELFTLQKEIDNFLEKY